MLSNQKITQITAIIASRMYNRLPAGSLTAFITE